MKNLITDAETFAFLKERANQYEANGFPGCDLPFIPVLSLFNRFPGIATTFCCTGHPEQDDNRFYICIAVDESGNLHLGEIYANILKTITEDSPKPQGYELPDQFKLRLYYDTSTDIRDLDKFYSHWLIDYEVYSEGDVNRIILAFTQALKSQLKKI